MKKILLVDDSTTIRTMLKSSLIGEFEIIEAENGKDALDKLSAQTIDLFLLDVNMPVMDGLTLLKEIRKIGAYLKTPVLMLTTETKEERKNEGKEAGATGWIIKPCEPDQLLGVIRKLI